MFDSQFLGSIYSGDCLRIINVRGRKVPNASRTGEQEERRLFDLFVVFVLLMCFEFWGLGKALGEATGANIIHSAISYLSKNPISKA